MPSSSTRMVHSPRSHALPSVVFGLLALGTLPAIARAQSNAVPGLDLVHSRLEGLASNDRLGPFPAGVSSFTALTQACNLGSVPIPWAAAMTPEHPFISFLVAREDGTRIIQISDYSFVKHAFAPTANSACAPCAGVGSSATTMGLNCSTTELAASNADNFWLGPPEEIDPWLATWEPTCSHFDRGQPAVAPPKDCDDVRSLTNAQAVALLPVGNRVKVPDAEFLLPGNFYAQSMYLVVGEPESARANNLLTRGFDASWNGTKFVLADSVEPAIPGTVLDRWPGASVSSATNGADDGRVFVAVKVSGPVQGFWHYEYAVFNRDNQRGVSGVQLPVCAEARVENFGFRDLDTDSSNDWVATRVNDRLNLANAQSALRWNSLYNFWFDSDAAPGTVSALLDAALPGAGAEVFAVDTTGPKLLATPYLGAGCSFTVVPNLYATGSPPQATLGNSTLALVCDGNLPNTGGVLVFSVLPSSMPLGNGCTQWVGGASGSALTILSSVVADANGQLRFPLPVPADPSFEGFVGHFQAAAFTPFGAPFNGTLNLSNGLQVRAGNAISDCP